MVDAIYHFRKLSGDVSVAMRVRAAIEEIGGIADWNPSLKDWDAHFDRIPAEQLEAHQARLLTAISRNAGEQPVLINVRVTPVVRGK